MNLLDVLTMIAVVLLALVPAPRFAPPNAPPKILYMHLSETRIHMGDVWSGKIITTTNVASLVIDAAFFAFVVPRKTFGDFEFRTRILGVPDIYRQKVYGNISAYNAAGNAERIPVELDFR
jgi:hypothetical protein